MLIECMTVDDNSRQVSKVQLPIITHDNNLHTPTQQQQQQSHHSSCNDVFTFVFISVDNFKLK